MAKAKKIKLKKRCNRANIIKNAKRRQETQNVINELKKKV